MFERATCSRKRAWPRRCNYAPLFPSIFALLFVVFECGIQAAYHFCSRFEERLRFGLVYFLNVAAQMIEQFAEFVPNVRGMRSRIF